jgi:hypothetical protein
VAELDLVVEEAKAEFEALRKLILFVDSGADPNRTLSFQARQVANNSSLLFMAAAFEESVRQLGLAYCEQLILKNNIPDDKLTKIRVGLWERACSNLSTKPMGSNGFDEQVAISNISVLSDFCIELNDLRLMVSHAVYNSRNLKSSEINLVFKRLGVPEACQKIGRSIEFRNFFGLDSVKTAPEEFCRYIDDFYRLRNTATHDLGAFRGMGAIDIERYIIFFEFTVKRLAEVLQAELDAIP